jgi:hypothetical protein
VKRAAWVDLVGMIPQAGAYSALGDDALRLVILVISAVMQEVRVAGLIQNGGWEDGRGFK